MKRKLKPLRLGFLVFLAIVLSSVVFEKIENRRFQASLRAQTLRQLEGIRLELESAISVDFYLTRGLIVYVAIHPDLSQSTFHKIADMLVRSRSSIRNIGLAPNNVISYIHPIRDNEQALGLNYETNQEQWPAVKAAIDSRKTIVAGPVNLVQGGVAFIIRTPIYLDSDPPGSGNSYWGMASIVIDRDKLFESSGLMHINPAIKIALGRVAEPGEEPEIINGELKVFREDPVILDVRIPDGFWQLAAVPSGGWEAPSPYGKGIRLGGLLFALLAGFGAFVWLQSLIRAQQRIEEALKNLEQANSDSRKNEAFLNAIIENIPNMIFVKEAQALRYVRYNKAGEELTGYRREDVLGKNDYDLFPREEAEFFTAKDREVLADKKVLDISSESLRTAHQGDRILHTKKISILDANGQAEYLLGISEDITVRKRAEQEHLDLLQQYERRNEQLEQFTYTVSHDLKTPLVTISCFAGQLKKDLEEGNNDCLAIDLDFIESSATEMGKLLDNLLHLARSGRAISERHPVKLAKIVHQAVEFSRGALEKCTVKVDIADDLPTVYGDPDRLREVFQNLLENAAKFTVEGSEALIEVGCAVVAEEVRCAVRDNGIGIPAEYQQQVFNLFEKLDPAAKGTGIGLAIVRRIIEEHGGLIWVESEGQGHGATFFFTLPMDKPVADPEMDNAGRPLNREARQESQEL